VKTSLFSSGTRRFAAVACLALGLTVAAPAFAVLGGAPMTPPAGAVVNTTLAIGTVVNEYVGASGVVFGIAWRGPRFPDLPSLLGDYFPQYVQGIKNQRANGGGRGPVSVTGSSLVVHSGGHMGAFTGQAYLPQALPAGVTASDIQ
jgi:hypothetical protein